MTAQVNVAPVEEAFAFRKILRRVFPPFCMDCVRKLANDFRKLCMMFDQAEGSSSIEYDQPRPWDAGTDALACLPSRDRVPVSSDYKSWDRDARESITRIVAHHAQHPSRHHRGRCFWLESCEKVDLLPRLRPSECAVFGREMRGPVEIAKPIH